MSLSLPARNLAPEELASLALRGLYEQYGYRKYRMSQFEEYSLYLDNKNFLPSENVIAFTDLDGRLMALRPDVTLSIVRHAAKEPKTAEKLYYNENVYRPDVGGHAFGEISQMGIEYIGSIDRCAEAEVVCLAAMSLAEIEKEYILEIGDLRFTVSLLRALGLDAAQRAAAMDALKQKNPAALRAAAAEAALPEEEAALLESLASLYGPFTETSARARALCRTEEMGAALDELDAIYAAADRVGLSGRLQIDFSLVNDTDYYNGILLRGYLRGLPGSVLAGGRYDNILKKFGKGGGGIGFALYLTEIAKLPRRRDSGDIDRLIRYAPDADPAVVAQTEAACVRAGLRVRALPDGEEPDGLQYESEIRIAGPGRAEKAGRTKKGAKGGRRTC